MHKPALLIFIKNPVAGKVKTRLAETVGNDKALEIYNSLLEHTRNIALETDADRYLFYSDHIEENDAWSDKDFIKKLQKGEDLGERMFNAFEEVLKKHSKAIIIGSDCPGITAKILKTAFRRMTRADFVAGPAEDGGYYLLGMKKNAATLFDEIEWGTKEVLDETLKKIWALEKTYALLPTLSDIDTEEDWKKHCATMG